LWRPKVYLTGVQKRDKALYAIGKGLNAEAVHADHNSTSLLPIFWGFDDPILGKVMKLMQEGKPFLHLDHAYFKRGYEHGNVRLNFGHFHQTRLLNVPDDRAALAKKRLEPWRKSGSHVVIVSPSERICRVLSKLRGIPANARDWCRWAEMKLKQHTDRPVMVKEKGGSFLDAIKTAWAVVSLSSVAEVEAVVHGVPVFVTQDSPAAQVGGHDLSQIESPIYPDREMWLRTLAYSQFHLSELADGTTKRIVEELYGDQYLRGFAGGPGEPSGQVRPGEQAA
jgi:hypothetical protein